MRKRIALLTALMLAAGIVLAQPPDGAKRRARSNDSAPRTPPSHADVKYGPLDRQVMDVWLAKSDKPTPMMVSIAGGGFSSGNTHLTKDDAPALLVYSSTLETPIRDQGVGIHHPRFGKALKEKMDALGAECQVHTGVQKGSHVHTRLTMDFVKRHFKMWDARAAASTLPSDGPWRFLPLITGGKIDAAWAQVGWGSFVVDGRSVRTGCDERGMGLMFYKPEKFGDCQIRIVYRCEKRKSNAGVFVRIDDGIVAKIGEKSPEVHRDANGKVREVSVRPLESTK